jgi:hypothetical protein
MKLLVRAVVTGFGLSIGAALYKKLAKQLGLEQDAAKDIPRPAGVPGGDTSKLTPSQTAGN